jgi:hypothetical protein
MAEDWKWTFLGFESEVEGRPVQVWYDGLSQDDQDMLLDTLLYLEKMTDRRWPDSVYNALEGAGGISEIRIPEFRGIRNGTLQRITLRIYGFFGPREFKESYTFLHGTDKKVRNDKDGKGIGKRRLDEIWNGHATVHKFSY